MRFEKYKKCIWNIWLVFLFSRLISADFYAIPNGICTKNYAQLHNGRREETAYDRSISRYSTNATTLGLFTTMKTNCGRCNRMCMENYKINIGYSIFGNDSGEGVLQMVHRRILWFGSTRLCSFGGFEDKTLRRYGAGENYTQHKVQYANLTMTSFDIDIIDLLFLNCDTVLLCFYM